MHSSWDADAGAAPGAAGSVRIAAVDFPWDRLFEVQLSVELG